MANFELGILDKGHKANLRRPNYCGLSLMICWQAVM